MPHVEGQAAARAPARYVAKKVEAPQNVDVLDLSLRNVAACVLRYYLADLELLFSASPFSLDSDNDKICAVSPNEQRACSSTCCATSTTATC